MKYTILAFFAALFLVFTSGCSFLARGEQIVSVTVTPSDAAVIANGAEYHILSPMFIEVPTRDALLITAYKPGYRTAFYAADSELSTTGKIDALGGIFILPAFGLLSNGAWRFTESNIVINLQPLPDPEESAIEQEATQRKRQEVARELHDQVLGMGPVPVTDATSKTSDFRSVDKNGVSVVTQDPLDKNAPADADDISIESKD
jgi:signal transduction histidine kinase